MNPQNTMMQLSEIAARIKEMREIMGWSIAELAEKVDFTEERCTIYESGMIDIPFSFIHKVPSKPHADAVRFYQKRQASRETVIFPADGVIRARHKARARIVKEGSQAARLSRGKAIGDNVQKQRARLLVIIHIDRGRKLDVIENIRAFALIILQIFVAVDHHLGRE